jgi:hypothetical protein
MKTDEGSGDIAPSFLNSTLHRGECHANTLEKCLKTAENKLFMFVAFISRTRSRVRFPIRSFVFFNPTSCTMTAGLTQTLTETSTSNLSSGSKERPARKMVNITAIFKTII